MTSNQETGREERPSFQRVPAHPGSHCFIQGCRRPGLWARRYLAALPATYKFYVVCALHARDDDEETT